MNEHSACPLCIFVIEDDPQVRLLTRSVLAQEGYEVRSAATATAALTDLQVMIPDLILLALSLPDMDGYTLLQRLRADDRLAAVPIVLYSAFSEDEKKAGALQRGAAGYIQKPCDPVALVAHITGYLTGNRQGAQPPVKEPQDALDAVRQQYRDQLPRKIVRMRELLEEEAVADLRLFGHRLAGSGGAHGFTGLSAVGKKIEQAGASENLTTLRDLQDELQREVERIVGET